MGDQGRRAAQGPHECNEKWEEKMRHLPNSALGLSLAGLVAVAAPASAEILIGGAICMTGLQAPLDEPGYKGAQVAIRAPS
jgi:hypothetical protein